MYLFFILFICILHTFYTLYISDVTYFSCNMALSTDLFYLVEFEDGVQVVPNLWMKEKNKCLYPPLKNDREITKAIKKREFPKDNWLLYPVKRVFGTYGKYNKSS